MTNAPHLEVDTASWSPAVLAAAQAMGARAICFYAYDPDVTAEFGDRNDAGGKGSGPSYFCGGWTPAVVAKIRAAGLVPRPIFGFRPASGLPTYQRCLQILQVLGIKPGERVLTDREGDLVPDVGWQVGFNQLLGQQGYLPAVYGNETTLDDGCLAYANGVWLANWGDSPAWDPAPELAAMPAFGSWAQRSWQYSHDQVIETAAGAATVDVSLSTFTVGDAPADPPPAAPAKPPREVTMFVRLETTGAVYLCHGGKLVYVDSEATFANGESAGLPVWNIDKGDELTWERLQQAYGSPVGAPAATTPAS